MIEKWKIKGSCLIVSTGSGFILSLLFLTYSLFCLIVGSTAMFIVFHHYYNIRKAKKHSSSKEKKEKPPYNKYFIPFLAFIGFLNLAVFIVPLIATPYGANHFQFAHNFEGVDGIISYEGEVLTPNRGYMYHYHADRPNNFIFNISYYTNVEIEGGVVDLIIMSGSSEDPNKATLLKEVSLTLAPEYDRFFYDYQLSETYVYDAEMNRHEYFFFKVRGLVSAEQFNKTRFNSQLSIITQPIGGEFGITDQPIPEPLGILEDAVTRNVFIMMFMIVIFLMFFLILWVTGRSKLAIYPLTIMILAGLLVLFVEIATSSSNPLIEFALQAVDSLSWIRFGDFDPIGALKAFIIGVGMVLAVFFWAFSIGTALAINIKLFVFWNLILGDFIGDITDI